ncbi:hypothetical protein [Pseudomonas phage PASB7]|uniref:Transmembrane protein n=10 Tax=Litunavirus TaxID=1920762 RepID=A0A0E3XBN0_9CAUD|nr:hypothetical protein ACQ21_gp70 [Pseudomonas phage Pa2]YP_009152573.1 hypothetical protein ACQ34_gp73 [Pseudomonas phage YH6]YP_009226133.1 transmembrane protein [Pseudomonas phage YH30]YP_009286294.1 hypothetical protein BI066_gp51 [Pseudomonas phage PEV2]YP_009290606.1 hypothetical protein BIZ95_gp72 [Pseudomonas phage vB_PaeP_MAG4]YP_010658953.1 hypothetical protein PP756_gp73 [Pseudomonas phage VB_PaeP_VL1]YP_010658994.1 hypothetical protein PP757_gp22 [Pseudomonas phage vB_PaeP_TUMS_P
MGVLKGLFGAGALAGAVIGILFIGFVFSWIFRILGVVVALFIVLLILCWVGWEWLKYCFSRKKEGEQ